MSVPFQVEAVSDPTAIPTTARRGRVRRPSPFDDVLVASYESGEWQRVVVNTSQQLDEAIAELTRAKQFTGLGADVRKKVDDSVDGTGTFALYFRGRTVRPRKTKAVAEAESLSVEEASEVAASDAVDVEDVKATEKVRKSRKTEDAASAVA